MSEQDKAPTQQDLLASARKIDERLTNAKAVIKEAKQSKRQAIKSGQKKTAQANAAASGDRVI